ncbi:uncharacterized protein GIQ15_04543 [Arthroderma uncinatum]|uniref:uncharacterized protein n=1 Tax=Arthroderma uncinatum TaxID=74035 RepID=UPI00144ABD13|nr:uncharacterized protein GIQ15_04543 [Arthroderma uncinatum]KAF3481784.1 hypothetical protein GIQ15_04543 [Arthroderma uncinatum]
MTSRPVHLLTSRASSAQRKHFGIFIPYTKHQQNGTVIHVVGAPMVGYKLEFKRNFSPSTAQPPHTNTLIGHVAVDLVADEGSDVDSAGLKLDYTPKGELEKIASQVPPPPISKNFMAPVDGIVNRRCQEWTMDFIERLVSRKYIEAEALCIAQSHRDPPEHGVGSGVQDR